MLGCADRICLSPPVALCSVATAALGTQQTPMHTGPRRWVKWGVRRTQRPAHTRWQWGPDCFPSMWSLRPVPSDQCQWGKEKKTNQKKRKNQTLAPRFFSLHAIQPSVHSTLSFYHFSLLSAEAASALATPRCLHGIGWQASSPLNNTVLRLQLQITQLCCMHCPLQPRDWPRLKRSHLKKGAKSIFMCCCKWIKGRDKLHTAVGSWVRRIYCTIVHAAQSGMFKDRGRI